MRHRLTDEAEVVDLGDPVRVTFFLPFTGGDAVLVKGAVAFATSGRPGVAPVGGSGSGAVANATRELSQNATRRSRAEVVGWTVTGQRLGVEVRYRVHLAGTPFANELDVDARDLTPHLRSA